MPRSNKKKLRDSSTVSHLHLSDLLRDTTDQIEQSLSHGQDSDSQNTIIMTQEREDSSVNSDVSPDEDMNGDGNMIGKKRKKSFVDSMRTKLKTRGRGRPRGSTGGRVSGVRPSMRGVGDVSMVIEEEEDDGLFGTVLSGRAALQSVVDDWIESYNANKESATLVLINFLINCSGSKGKLTQEMRDQLTNAVIIREMANEFDANTSEYPIIATGIKWKKFKTNLCEFIQTLIRQCQFTILYDQYLMDNVFSMLIGLSDSQVRAFRHTATLVVMKMMTCLIDVYLTVDVTRDATQRQYESERQKVLASGENNSLRLDMLTQKRDELQQNQEDIKNMLNYLFKSVFVHRYRDVVPDIRSICFSEIGYWMRRLPDMFLDDSCLKYVGWTLHDKDSHVRLSCLQSLYALYHKHEFTSQMELFTNKFKDRIVAMTLDKDFDVAALAVKVMTLIHSQYDQVITDRDCEQVYELVYVTNRSLAQAAGEFLNEKLFQSTDESLANVDLRTKRGKKISVNTTFMKDLVQYFMESELHDHATYLVDALIETHPMIKDWECMTDLLLEEQVTDGTEEDEFGDQQETALIEIMVCAIKQAATGEIPVGRTNRKTQLTSKELKKIQEDKSEMTEHFVRYLSVLLTKYRSDANKLANLLLIPQYFDLSFFTSETRRLESILKMMNMIVESHSDEDVLQAAAKSYHCLYDEDYAFSREVDSYKKDLFDILKHDYQQMVISFQETPVHDLNNQVIAIPLKRLTAFVNCHDLTSLNLWDDIFEKWINPSCEEPIQYLSTECSINYCHDSLIWQMHYISSQDASKVPREYIRNQKSKIDDFVKEMRKILENHDHESVRKQAFDSICDLLVIFSDKLTDEKVIPLISKPNSRLITSLETFINGRVFVDADDDEDPKERMEMVNENRHFLASFCKLFSYNIIPISHAAIVFKHYVKFFLDFGDIIKMAMSKTREINKILTARAMMTALTSVFTDLRLGSALNPNAFTKRDEEFQLLKELAKRFALSFGFDNLKNREAIAELHQEGIKFGLSGIEAGDDGSQQVPPNIAFFEILSEFSHKLYKNDKKVVVQFLDTNILKAFGYEVNVDEHSYIEFYRQGLTSENVSMLRALGKEQRQQQRRMSKNRIEEREEEASQIDSEMSAISLDES